MDKEGKHLIEKYVLSFAPSLGTLAELQKRNDQQIIERTLTSTTSTSTSSAIIGNPNYHGQMEQLLGTSKEAEAVHKIMKESNHDSELLLYNHATKGAVIESMVNSKIIHLASHGSKDGIYLSGDGSDDNGKLTMEEVQQNLDLQKTELVVQSACDTFKGELRADGVVGITRSFLVAGSSTVIASLWPVYNESTQEMMTNFYKILLSNDEDDITHDGGAGGDICLALQQTMIAKLQENRESGKDLAKSIMEWAPFLVYGLNTTRV